jgi:CheY-like chemotaxis protein
LTVSGQANGCRVHESTFMSYAEHRQAGPGDRRRVPRGGRRGADRPGRHPVVLVADSHDLVRESVAKYLEHFGFQVARAANGPEALAAVRTAPPHVVLVEGSLPDLPAPAMTEQLHGHPATQTTAVIVTVAGPYDLAGDRRDARFDAVLMKPFSLASMLTELRQVLRAQLQRHPGSGLG